MMLWSSYKLSGQTTYIDEDDMGNTVDEKLRMRADAEQPAQHVNRDTGSQEIEIVVLGTGAGATYVYYREPSSSFVVFKGGEPVLLCDLGYGITAACKELLGRLPPNIYISHNHGDHSGELPVVLGQEASSGASKDPNKRLTLFSHPDVMAELREHRLRELCSTGETLEQFAHFTEVPSSCLTRIGSTGLAVRPFRSRHSETCYGLVLYNEGRPFLGWTADSGYDEELYCAVTEAPVLLVDARMKGNKEHAGFDALEKLVCLPSIQGKRIYITGYGRQDEAPRHEDLPGTPRLEVARPGIRIHI